MEIKPRRITLKPLCYYDAEQWFCPSMGKIYTALTLPNGIPLSVGAPARMNINGIIIKGVITSVHVFEDNQRVTIRTSYKRRRYLWRLNDAFNRAVVSAP